MKVIAVAKGFHVGPRAVGDEFDMDEKGMKTEKGKPVLPSWVVSGEKPKAAEKVAEKKDEKPSDKKDEKADGKSDLV